MQLKMPSNGYVKQWFMELMCTGYKYNEPILADEAACIIKRVCDFLKQDAHVFIMSVEIMEEYIKQMDSIGRKIEDPLLSVGCVVMLCSKFAGEQSDIQVKSVQDCFESISSMYPVAVVTQMERDIFQTIQGRFVNVCDRFLSDCSIKQLIFDAVAVNDVTGIANIVLFRELYIYRVSHGN